MGKPSRDKGARIEREIIARHQEIDVFCERVPLSGALHYRGSGADVDLYLDGRERAPLVCEVKTRKAGSGFIVLERWLADFDVLFLRRDRKEPLVLVPWPTWVRLLKR